VSADNGLRAQHMALDIAIGSGNHQLNHINTVRTRLEERRQGKPERVRLLRDRPLGVCPVYFRKIRLK
jgi:hypothetical protein